MSNPFMKNSVDTAECATDTTTHSEHEAGVIYTAESAAATIKLVGSTYFTGAITDDSCSESADENNTSNPGSFKDGDLILGDELIGSIRIDKYGILRNERTRTFLNTENSSGMRIEDNSTSPNLTNETSGPPDFRNDASVDIEIRNSLAQNTADEITDLSLIYANKADISTSEINSSTQHANTFISLNESQNLDSEIKYSSKSEAELKKISGTMNQNCGYINDDIETSKYRISDEAMKDKSVDCCNRINSERLQDVLEKEKCISNLDKHYPAFYKSQEGLSHYRTVFIDVDSDTEGDLLMDSLTDDQVNVPQVSDHFPGLSGNSDDVNCVSLQNNGNSQCDIEKPIDNLTITTKLEPDHEKDKSDIQKFEDFVDHPSDSVIDSSLVPTTASGMLERGSLLIGESNVLKERSNLPKSLIYKEKACDLLTEDTDVMTSKPENATLSRVSDDMCSKDPAGVSISERVDRISSHSVSVNEDSQRDIAVSASVDDDKSVAMISDQEKFKMKNRRFNPFDRDVHFADDHFATDDGESGPRKLDAASKSSSGSSFTTLSLAEIDTDVSYAELGLAEDYFSRPEGHFGLTGVEELEMAIDNCKELIHECVPHSEKHKNLIKKLIQLRLKVQELKEGDVPVETDIRQVVGHRFRLKNSRSSKHYCEKCNSLIWGMVQAWYRCTDCGYCCHDKCLNLITRTCANVKVQDYPSYILSICPEKGLASQSYRCAECRLPIGYLGRGREPRLCDYTGCYYCDLCHWNDSMIIPARVVHNWDFEPKKVCRATKQLLRLMSERSVFRIQDLNPMLFNFVGELHDVKKCREEFLVMKKYFLCCKVALDAKLLLRLKHRQHFVENSDMYSLKDLVDINADSLLPELTAIHSSFARHIKHDCELCKVKGFICEICNAPDVLFPFDDVAVVCSRCSYVLHRYCFVQRTNRCPRCERRERRGET